MSAAPAKPEAKLSALTERVSSGRLAPCAEQSERQVRQQGGEAAEDERRHESEPRHRDDAAERACNADPVAVELVHTWTYNLDRAADINSILGNDVLEHRALM
jgi:hypothetical protein